MHCTCIPHALSFFHIYMHKCTHMYVWLCTVSEKQRIQAYKKEMAQLAETATTLMENMSDKPSTFTSATHVEHIRAMFKVNQLNKEWEDDEC